jgi:hypothetical protein
MITLKKVLICCLSSLFFALVLYMKHPHFKQADRQLEVTQLVYHDPCKCDGTEAKIEVKVVGTNDLYLLGLPYEEYKDIAPSQVITKRLSLFELDWKQKRRLMTMVFIIAIAPATAFLAVISMAFLLRLLEK